MEFLSVLIFVLLATCNGMAEVYSKQNTQGAVKCPSLNYSIFWNGMPAGKAQLQCHQSDEEVLVHLKGETHAVLDALYRLRITAKSRLLADGAVPLEYQENTREGRKNTKTTTFVFAPEQNIVNVFKNGRLRRTLQVPAGTMDPLGGAYRFLYHFRENGKPNFLRVTDGRRIFEISFTFKGNEAVKTPWGNHDTEVWQASVRVLTGKPHALEKSSIRLWTLTGSPSIVVKMTVALPYGEFSTQLAEPVLPTPPAKISGKFFWGGMAAAPVKILGHTRRGGAPTDLAKILANAFREGPMSPPLRYSGAPSLGADTQVHPYSRKMGETYEITRQRYTAISLFEAHIFVTLMMRTRSALPAKNSQVRS